MRGALFCTILNCLNFNSHVVIYWLTVFNMKNKRYTDEEDDEPTTVYDKLLTTFSNSATSEVRKQISQESKPREVELSRPKPKSQERKKRKIETSKKTSQPTILVDPFATTTHYKQFSNNQMFVDLNINDVETKKYDKSKIAIDFSRKDQDIWYQFFNKPHTEEELAQIVREFENKRKQYVQISGNDDAQVDELYEILGKKIDSNVARKLPNPIENLAQDGLVERDLVKKWKEYMEDTGVSDSFRNDFQKCLFTLFNDYRDVYYPHITTQNRQSVVESYVLHAVNHLLK
jgi:hypothetical protein